MNLRWDMVLIYYTYAHFAVDFSCFYILFYLLNESREMSKSVFVFLLYNIIAFGLQAFIGAYYDKNRKEPLAVLGIVLVFTGLLLNMLEVPFWGLIFAALGNAFFHVEGGCNTVLLSKGKFLPNGIFSSAGALGVLAGSVLGGLYVPYPLLPMAFILPAFVFMMILWSSNRLSLLTGEPFKLGNVLKNETVLVYAILLCAVSQLSYSFVFIDKEDFIFIFLFYSCLSFGKIFGTYLMDELGVQKAVFICFLISILSILAINKNVMYISGMAFATSAFYNIALGGLSNVFPKNTAFAFALTKTGLLLGVMPSYILSLLDMNISFFVVEFSLLFVSFMLIWRMSKQTD